MSISGAPVTTSVTSSTLTRTSKIEIFSPYMGKYNMRIIREQRTVDSNGADVAVPVSKPTIVVPDVTPIAALSYTVDGVTLTVAQVAKFLSTIVDAWDTTPPSGVTKGRF